MNSRFSRSLGLVGALAAFAVFTIACGDMMMTTDGGSTKCTAGSCGAGKACHPITGECITSCSKDSECPASATKCDTYVPDSGLPDGGGEKFCQCTSDSICNSVSTGTICSVATLQCAAKCGGDAGFTCPATFTCNATTGQCTKGSTTMDAGVDAGVDAGMPDAGTPCAVGQCGTGFACTDGLCKPSASCNMANAQPDTCPYGQRCDTACVDAPVAPASCTNFMAGTTPRAWNGGFDGGTTGAVIIGSQPQSAASPFCTNADGGTRASDVAIAFSAYTKGSPFPTAYDMFQTGTLKYFRTDGTSCDLSNLGTCGLFTPSRYAMSRSADGKNLTNTPAFFCPGASFTSLEVGLYFNGGNPFCGTAR